MIYNMENTSKIGVPVRVFDANTIEVKWCMSCDTETGRVTRMKCNNKGIILIDPITDKVILEELFMPAPLTVVPCTVEEANSFSAEVMASRCCYEGCTCKSPFISSNCNAHALARKLRPLATSE